MMLKDQSFRATEAGAKTSSELPMSFLVGIALAAVGAALGIADVSVQLVVALGLGILGTVVFFHRRPRRAGNRDSFRGFWWFAILPFYIQTFDVTNRLRSGSILKFVAVGLVGLGLANASLTIRKSRLASAHISDLALRGLAIYMAAGAFVGRLFLGTRTAALGAAVPLLIVLIPTPQRRVGFRGSASLLRALTHALLAIVLMTAVAQVTPLLGSSGRAAFGHEKAHLVVAAPIALWLARRFRLFALALALVGITFVAYPAATYVLVFVGALLTLSFTSGRQVSRRIGVALMVSVPIGLIVAAAYLASTSALASEYFSATGKQSNAEFRTLLYTEAGDRIRQSPLVGSFFTGETVVPLPSNRAVTIDGRRFREVPPHSDVLEVWMVGGALGLGLLLVWLVGTNIEVARFCRSDRDAIDKKLVRLLLVIINGFFVVGLVNPIFRQVGNTLILAGSYVCLRLVLFNHVAPPRQMSSEQRLRVGHPADPQA